MADYPSLAALRSALTTDDPDKRGNAYSSVYEADVRPSAVLGSDPEDATVEALVDADVIPQDTGDQPSISQVQQEQLTELKRIGDILEDEFGGGA